MREGNVREGDGAKELPAFEGEDARLYIHRLAVRLGYLAPGEAGGVKSMPRVDGAGLAELVAQTAPAERVGTVEREPGEDG